MTPEEFLRSLGAKASRMCREHERPLEECRTEAKALRERERRHERVRALAEVLLIERGLGVTLAWDTAEAFEREAERREKVDT